MCGDNHDKQDSLRRYSSDAYALAVEPVKIRSERVITLAEAYAMFIFGGLFLAGTWVLYEWGSPTNYELTDEEGKALFTDWTGNMARVFFLTMTFAICCNLSLALLSSILWFHAIVYGNRENFILKP
eukprot:scaffold4329_cov23-Cyclotella_meneghiniana.AAC.1